MSEFSEWFRKLGSPRYVVAPMVDASELAWRILCRRHGAELCYTPMLHSNVFTRDPKYRKDGLATCEEDRPLIVQFCGNDPNTMAAAAKLAQPYCDAIDINLGCPQAIAKRGRYGSFLQDEWDLLKKIISAMSDAVEIPITCKVRVYDSIDKTVEYARMLEQAGCTLLTVHGRTRLQKGPLTGVASWDHIKAVRNAVSIPIFANGNIQCLEDVHRCLEYTGVHGVMTAEGNLTNPFIFQGVNPTVWEVAEEYLQLVHQYPCPTAYIRGHMFKIFHKIFALEENNQDRQILATAQNLDDFWRVCKNIKDKYLAYHNGEEQYIEEKKSDLNTVLPPWICQPYVRISPEEHRHKLDTINSQQNIEDRVKRVHEDSDGNVITRKKMKKLRRIMRRPIKCDISTPTRNSEICHMDHCPNPRGGKCLYELCKQCCRNKCFVENLDCTGHRILVRTRRDMAKKFAAQNDNKKEDTVQIEAC